MINFIMNKEILRIDDQGAPEVVHYTVTHEHDDIIAILLTLRCNSSIDLVGHNSNHYPAVDIDSDDFDHSNPNKQCWTTVSFPKYKGWNVLAHHVHDKKIVVVLENPMETP